MANGSRHSLYMIPEVTYGVTPATPAMLKVRHNSCTLGIDKDTLMSEELRSDRQIADFRMGQNKLGGNIVADCSTDAQFTALMEGALCGTWTTNVLKAGILRKSFTMLRAFEDLGIAGTDKQFQAIKGCEISGMEIKVVTSKIATATFDVLGQTQAFGLTAVAVAGAGATLGNASTNSPMDAFTGAITEGGSAIAVVTEISLKLDNNMDRRFVIGSKDTIRPQQGRSVVTGSITAYFESSVMLDKFLSESASSLSFTLQAGSSSLLFNIPNIKYTGGKPDVSNEGSITLTMPFQAVYDSGSASQIVVTRVP